MQLLQHVEKYTAEEGMASSAGGVASACHAEEEGSSSALGSIASTHFRSEAVLYGIWPRVADRSPLLAYGRSASALNHSEPSVARDQRLFHQSAQAHRDCHRLVHVMAAAPLQAVTLAGALPLNKMSNKRKHLQGCGTLPSCSCIS